MGILTGMATPNYNSYVSRVMKRDAVRGLCDMALAITLYKASIGQYPARSEDLVPAYIDQIPLDPFDNQPLKMKPIDGGLDLYSVGLEQETASDKPGEMIHFYLGREAYDVYRIKPREGLKQQN
jgi:hypothetical protein